MGDIRVGIVGVGNCAASLVQGVHYYRDADPTQKVPGLMHVQFGPYHVRDITFVAAFDVDAKKVGRDLSEAISASQNNTIKICDVPPQDVIVQRGHTLDGLGKYYRETIEESDEEPVDVVATLRAAAVDVLDLLPARRLGARGEVLRAVRHRRRRGIRQRLAGVHRGDARMGGEVRGGRRPDRRRRHQVAGRSDHHPPGAGEALRGSGRRAAAHHAAERRRQHGLHEHARARPARVEEDQQDAGCDLADPRPRPRQAQCAHRAVGLCRLARRPQVGLRPARGQGVRRRAAEPRVQARGLGLTEFGRRHHRRAALRQDRHRIGASAARSCPPPATS